jgi:hypothetical protein
VLKNDGAEAWDLGDGVLGLTFKSKANSIDQDIIEMIHLATERAERDFRGMVIATRASTSAWAPTSSAWSAANQQQWEICARW